MAIMGMSTPTKDRLWMETETGDVLAVNSGFGIRGSGLCSPMGGHRVGPGDDDELMCHELMWNSRVASQHHVAALPGAREPIHRRGSVHEFLRGRELVRHARKYAQATGISGSSTTRVDRGVESSQSCPRTRAWATRRLSPDVREVDRGQRPSRSRTRRAS